MAAAHGHAAGFDLERDGAEGVWVEGRVVDRAAEDPVAVVGIDRASVGAGADLHPEAER